MHCGVVAALVEAPGIPAAVAREVAFAAATPVWRVIETTPSNHDRSTPYLQGECSYIRAVAEEEIQRRSSANARRSKAGQVLVFLITPMPVAIADASVRMSASCPTLGSRRRPPRPPPPPVASPAPTSSRPSFLAGCAGSYVGCHASAAAAAAEAVGADLWERIRGGGSVGADPSAAAQAHLARGSANSMSDLVTKVWY